MYRELNEQCLHFGLSVVCTSVFFPSVELRCVNFPHLEMFHTILYTQLPLLESIFSFSTR